MLPSRTPLRLAIAAALAFGSAHASEDPAAKIDNGLGELPHYREWQRHPELAGMAAADRPGEHRVAGEKLDSGLGELPPYSEWKHHPELARFAPDMQRPRTVSARP